MRFVFKKKDTIFFYYVQKGDRLLLYKVSIVKALLADIYRSGLYVGVDLTLKFFIIVLSPGRGFPTTIAARVSFQLRPPSFPGIHGHPCIASLSLTNLSPQLTQCDYLVNLLLPHTATGPRSTPHPSSPPSHPRLHPHKRVH